MPALAPFLVSAAAGLAGEAPGSAGASDAKALAEVRARRTADDFETMFLEQSLERMFSSAGEEGPMAKTGQAARSTVRCSSRNMPVRS